MPRIPGSAAADRRAPRRPGRESYAARYRSPCSATGPVGRTKRAPSRSKEPPATGRSPASRRDAASAPPKPPSTPAVAVTRRLPSNRPIWPCFPRCRPVPKPRAASCGSRRIRAETPASISSPLASASPLKLGMPSLGQSQTLAAVASANPTRYDRPDVRFLVAIARWQSMRRFLPALCCACCVAVAFTGPAPAQFYRPPPPGFGAPPCQAVTAGPFRGAARGAAGGALFGAIGGNAGRGAAIGAAVGGVAGAARRGAARNSGFCH